MNQSRLLGCLLLWVAHPLQASEVSGYLKAFSIYQFEQSATFVDRPDQALGEASLRLMWEPKGSFWTSEFHYEIQGFQSSREGWVGSDLVRSNTSDRYRFDDLNPVIAEGKKSVLRQNLDRANVRLKAGQWDITLGRQALTMGSARLVSPVDVFLPFDLRVLDTEYRPGIDALRLERALGDLSALDIGWVVGAEGQRDQSAMFAQWITNYQGIDYATTWIERDQVRLLGLGVTGAIGQHGVWFEAAKVAGREDYWRSSLGIDGGVGDTGLWMVELHYNGAGTSESEGYLSQNNVDAYRNFGVFLFARRYVLSALSVQLSAVTGFASQWVFNLDDQSSFFQVSIDRHVSDEWGLRAGVYRFGGDSDLKFTMEGPALGSEFGMNPHVVFVGARYYF